MNFRKKDTKRLQKELDLLQNRVLNNTQFWNDVRNCTYKCADKRILKTTSRKGKCPYERQEPKDTKLYSSKEIHDLLRSGDDEVGNPKDSIINLKLKLYNKLIGPTKGKTSGCTLLISSVRRKTIKKEQGVYAAHILHEEIHVLGFKHISNSVEKNKLLCNGYYVPNAIGKIARKYLGLNVIGEEDLCVNSSRFELIQLPFYGKMLENYL
ncbi:hypothetical protein [Croceitalea rosinachiae]|uniref:SprT-like family protein n=1 Tax=Croceitalea rosinachiae TaxID=3075596 RepID=A0ABU3ACY4_9FLAO|nr:hypothetical protein [Croceitalea sp. F388]MDT0608036.1 hypothetical protein [Croceitalea sp. F388]